VLWSRSVPSSTKNGIATNPLWGGDAADGNGPSPMASFVERRPPAFTLSPATDLPPVTAVAAIGAAARAATGYPACVPRVTWPKELMRG
jgi:hypothetical protein